MKVAICTDNVYYIWELGDTCLQGDTIIYGLFVMCHCDHTKLNAHVHLNLLTVNDEPYGQTGNKNAYTFMEANRALGQ